MHLCYVTYWYIWDYFPAITIKLLYGRSRSVRAVIMEFFETLF